MYDQLQAIEDRYEELGELLSDPEVISDTKRFMQLSKEEANTRETVEVYRRYKEVVQGITDTEELLGEKLDDEMAELAKEELSELKRKRSLRRKIKILLLPKIQMTIKYHHGNPWSSRRRRSSIIRWRSFQYVPKVC